MPIYVGCEPRESVPVCVPNLLRDPSFSGYSVPAAVCVSILPSVLWDSQDIADIWRWIPLSFGGVPLGLHEEANPFTGTIKYMNSMHGIMVRVSVKASAAAACI